MRYIQIPTDERVPWYKERVLLAGTSYNLELKYNTRADRWFLSISDAADVPILVGVPLLIDRDLTAQYPTLRLPPGAIFCADKTGAGREPGLSSFLLDHMLVHADPTA